MKKIITFNANGIRSAARKHFFDWVLKQNADCICIQETKASQAQLKELDSELFFPPNYHYFFCDAQKKGYSGVAIFTKIKPVNIITEMPIFTEILHQKNLTPNNHDIHYIQHQDNHKIKQTDLSGIQLLTQEGRYLELEFPDFKLVSLYLPSGGSSEHRQSVKFLFMKYYFEYLKKSIQNKKPMIICGDWNIAHTQQDLKNWRANQKESGFLPEERAWMDQVLNELGWIDSYRYFNPDKIEYTWWSNFGRAWDNNTGWRIDYQIISPSLKDLIQETNIYRDQKFSDHAPFSVVYNF